MNTQLGPLLALQGPQVARPLTWVGDGSDARHTGREDVFTTRLVETDTRKWILKIDTSELHGPECGAGGLENPDKYAGVSLNPEL